MQYESRIAGFHKLTLSERRRTLSERTGLAHDEVDKSLQGGGLDAPTADKMVENAVGCGDQPRGGYSVVGEAAVEPAGSAGSGMMNTAARGVEPHVRGV